MIIQEGTPRAVEVYLPPVGKGQFYNLFVDFDTGNIEEIDDVDDTDILSCSTVKTQQVWERPRPPEKYKQKRKEELRAQRSDPSYFDPELEEYREQEWHRREYGVWFMNNGRPVYLTGSHYMYLTHWKIDIGFPKFRWPDLEYFYFLQWNIENPYSRGLIEMTKRRFGKTFRGGLFVYEYTSRNKKAYGGIQSKTALDARNKVFGQAVVEPFQSLIDFFRPRVDEMLGLRSKGNMRFFQSNKRGKLTIDDIMDDDADELASWIEPRSQKASAFDGEKLHRYLRDECFKLEEEDIYAAHEVVKPDVEIDGRIIGKMLYTSTVEEFNERSRVSNKLLWDMSSMDTIDHESGMHETSTGLYQFFVPDYKTMFFDKYGVPDEKRGKEYFDAKREQYIRNNNHKGLVGFIRKHPRTPEEAFWSSEGMCIYDEIRLRTGIQNLEPVEKDIVKRGELKWIKDRYGNNTMQVKWIPKNNGPFYIARWPDDNEINNIKRLGGGYRPGNKTTYIIGIDPFDHDLIDMSALGVRPSNGAAAVYMKNKLDDEDFNENFVAYYLYRRAKSSQFYEDMMKLAVFYGCEVLYESNKPGIKNFFVDHNMSGLLMRYDGKKAGIPASRSFLETLMEETENFLENGGYERVVFIQMLQDWLDYDPSDTQKYDLAAATGIALIGSRKLMKRVKEIEKRKNNAILLARRYKQTILN